MLYYYSITVWEPTDDEARANLHRGIVAAKNLGKAANRVVKEYTRTSGEDEIDELTIIPFSNLFATGDIAEMDEINNYLNENDD